MTVKSKKRASRSELHDVCEAIDARKAAMAKPKLWADVCRKPAAKSAAKKTIKKGKTKRRSNASRNDLMTRGHRVKGSGWTGENQK